MHRRGRTRPDEHEVRTGLADVRAGAEAVAVAREQARAAEDALAERLRAQWQRGLTWAELAQATSPAGITTAEAARIFATAYEVPSVQDPEGISVAEAAKVLGVQRATVYARIDRGELRSTVDGRGRTRVLLD